MNRASSDSGADRQRSVAMWMAATLLGLLAVATVVSWWLGAGVESRRSGAAADLREDSGSVRSSRPGRTAVVPDVEAELPDRIRWVDREAGLVRVPVERAVRMLIEAGRHFPEETR